MKLISLGWSNLEIAEHCFISINSVKSYIRSAYRKIGVRRRAQAVGWALGLHGAPGGLPDEPNRESPADDAEGRLDRADRSDAVLHLKALQ